MIPSELIHVDESGNAVIGKNLEADGTTKLNGGLSPILIKNGKYQTPEGIFTYSVLDFGEFKDTGSSILGLIIDGEFELIGIGDYNISGTASDNFDIYGVSMVNSDFERIHLDDGEVGSEPIYESVAFIRDTQSKLYRHKLRLNNLYILMYDSTSNLNVGSVADLRTIMKISSNSDSQILPVCTEDGTAMAPLAVTIHYCKVDGSDVTTVSDTVTTL